MPEAVYRMMTLLCALVAPLPVGTNLGVLHLLWMLVSGQLLSTRGAVIPGLSACGLAPRAVRRAWAALGHGDWRSARLLARWQEVDAADPRSRTHERLLVRAAVQRCAENEVLVFDAGFGLALLQEEGATRFVVRCAKNATFRRRAAPAYQGRGRPPTRGQMVRPLPR